MSFKSTDPLNDEGLALYVAATSGDAGSEQLRQFADWAAANPRRQQWIERLRRHDGTARALRGVFADEIRALRRRRMIRRRMWLLTVCAVSLAALVVSTGDRTRAVPPGPPETFVLTDGSTVVVAGGGAVEIPLAPWTRSVRLLRGEALFSVVHKDDAPFTVRCGAAEIQDIGTRFLVRADGAATSVAVFEGSVRLSAPAAVQVLGAGQAAAARAEGIVQLPTEDENEATAWRRGRMVFRDVPLSVAVQRLSAAWGQPVRLGAAQLADLHVSGDFLLDDRAALLRGLSLTLPLSVRQGDDGIDLTPR